MEKSMSKMLIETVVKQALKSIKDNPERGIRNLVDMALEFSKGRFQKHFFTVTQMMLQNESSSYYALVRNIVTHTDTDRLFTFGMNLGYNSCTEGARCIRKNEVDLDCNIPWTLSLQIDAANSENNYESYDSLISEGEGLGIHTWMIFSQDKPQKILSFAEHHPDSVFFVFCEPTSISHAFLDEVTDFHNVMLVLRYDESLSDLCATLREMRLLYSVWYQYGQQDVELILNGDLFSSTQELLPAFAVFVSEQDCPDEIQKLIYKTVKRARDEQCYSTILWELQRDNLLIDSIISGDAISVYFDKNGDLCDRNKKYESEHHNLFQSSLNDILKSSCLKEITACN